MTDEATTETETEVDGPKQLREALKSEKAKNKTLTKQLMGDAYKGAGLDPETGLGKAIAKEYKGDPTSEGLLAFAKEEYDWELPAVPDNPQAQTITTEQQKLDSVTSVSTPVVPLNDQDALAKANRDQDFVAMGRIKSDQLRGLMKP